MMQTRTLVANVHNQDELPRKGEHCYRCRSYHHQGHRDHADEERLVKDDASVATTCWVEEPSGR